MIEGLDKLLGDILDQLENLGVAESTLVLFLGYDGSDAPLGDVHAVSSALPLPNDKLSDQVGTATIYSQRFSVLP